MVNGGPLQHAIVRAGEVLRKLENGRWYFWRANASRVKVTHDNTANWVPDFSVYNWGARVPCCHKGKRESGAMPVAARDRYCVSSCGGFVQMKTARIGRHRKVLSQVRRSSLLGCFESASYVLLDGFAMASPDVRRWATSRRWRRGAV